MIFLCFVVLPLISKLTVINVSLPEHKFYYLFFLSNYDSQQYIFALKFLWTVAIEEQYYWTWALCLLLFRKSFAAVTIFFLFAYFTTFFILPKWNVHLPENPLLYLMNFATGSILAIYFSYKRMTASPAMALLLFFVLALMWWVWQADVFIAKIFLCGAVGMLILTVHAFCKRANVKRNFFYQIFEELGKYTYGLYVYSGLVITAFAFCMKSFQLSIPLYLVFLLQLALLLLIAKLSYKYYEERFLRLSARYR
jgi:peptidoglycan/LPS O-acetylase OafA/YrhL